MVRVRVATPPRARVRVRAPPRARVKVRFRVRVRVAAPPSGENPKRGAVPNYVYYFREKYFSVLSGRLI